jgi:hypothetical protein
VAKSTRGGRGPSGKGGHAAVGNGGGGPRAVLVWNRGERGLKDGPAKVPGGAVILDY